MVKVYVGPSIAGIVQEGAAFSGGYPPKVAAAVRQAPFLADLMVPPEKLAEARKEVRNPDSALGALYRRAGKGEKGNGV